MASLLPQTTFPQASSAAQLELDIRARQLRARGVAGNAILGAFRCRCPPSHPTFTPDNPLQTTPFLIARYDDARAKPTHSRALRRRRRSLARSIARAVCGGSDGGLAVGHALRHALHTRHTHCASCSHRHRASRVSSPFSVPPPRTHSRAARCDGARSLAQSCACGAAVMMVVWQSVTPRVSGGKHHPGCLSVPLSPKSPNSPPPTILSKPSRSSSPGTTMLVPHRQVQRCSGKAHSRARITAAAALARSLDRARSLWRWR